MEVPRRPMRKNSYESILSAVGRVLDQAEARSFIVRDQEDGLLVETFDDTGGRQYALHLDLPDLAELVAWGDQADEAPHSAPVATATASESTLRSFLARHELARQEQTSRERELVGAPR